MKKRLYLLLLMVAALTGSAESPLEVPMRNSLRFAAAPVVQSSYPNADVVLIDDVTTLKYEASGAYHYSCDIALKVLTEKGRQEQSTVSLGYDAAYGSSQFLMAELIKPDGRVVSIDLEAQSREAINSGQMDANIYDPNSKTIQLSVPDLEIDDVLHYSYRGEQTKAVVPNTWSDLSLFETTYPILHAVYQVDAPAELPIIRSELKAPIDGTVTYSEEAQNGGVRHTWNVSNVPQMFEEPEMPDRHTVVQRVLLSTIPDWETLSKWYWELSQPRLNAVNDAMKAKVQELTAGLSDRQKKIEAIFRFVSQDIRYMGITVEDEAPGYEPHDVCLTFDNRYGVCRDKAALLVTMLRLAEIEAYPVLIYVGPKKDPEVPQPWFNHAITAVREVDGSYQLMDSTNENTRDLLPAYLCNRSYLVAHPDGEPLKTSPIIPAEANMLTIQIAAKLDDSNVITADASLSFEGIHDTAYRGRLARLKPEEREPYFEERLKRALGSATLTSLEISPAEVRDTTQPLSIKLGFKVENAVVTGADESLFKVPSLISDFGLFGALLGDGIGLDQRKYPLHTEITCGMSETVTVDFVPTSLRPSILPKFETIDTPQLYINRTVSATNGQMIATADLKLRAVEFTPEEYLQLKDSLKTSEQNVRKRILLTSSGFPQEADFATLSERIYYAVYNPSTVSRLHTVKKKVLTYAGKTACSDIKVSYNSAMEEVFVNYARVIAPDGTLREIDPSKEVNLMDAPWTAGAPRYPAEKILVANLPGVEIGSIIEYEILTKSQNLPLFSAVNIFDAHNPIVKKTVVIEMSMKTDLKIGNMAPNIMKRRTYHNGENVVHEWSVNNRPMIRKEASLPPSWVFTPALFLSTGDSASYADVVRKAAMAAAGRDKAAQAKAEELTKGVKGRLNQMIVLRDFVDRSIRQAGPGLSSLPLSAITPADQILAEGYGNSTDRAILLYALCAAADLKPRFVLSSELPLLNEINDPLIKTFQYQFFDTLLVAIKHDDQIYYLGDSGQYARVGALAHDGRLSMDLDSTDLKVVRALETNRTATLFSMDLAEDGAATLVKKNVFSGVPYEEFHKTFAEYTPEDLRREQQAQISRISQSAEAVGPMKISIEMGVLELAANVKNYAVRDGDYLYFTLPEGLGNLLGLKSNRRDSPFYIEAPLDVTFAYEITLPKGWTPSLIPESFCFVLPNGGGTVTTTAQVMGTKLVVEQHADLKPALIPVEEYDRLQTVTDRLTRPAARTVLLKKL